MKTKPNSAYCLRQGLSVIEFVCQDIRLVRCAAYVLDFLPREATYDVTFQMAPVKQCDYMALNALFNLVLAQRQQPANKEIAAQIAEKLKGLSFGNTLGLRILNGDGQAINYAFKPQMTDRTLPGQDTLRVLFGELPRYAGIPYTTVSATITSRAFAYTPTVRKPDRFLLQATKFWPSDNADIKRLAAQITDGAATQDAKVQALLDWLMPGKHIKYGGDVVGSRYGTLQVLQQGFGHCWDFADVFITLCRASGIPCRQVAGWWYGGQTGHVWAEVLVEGKGWQQVDPIAGMACGSDYIAYLTTEDGEMPILYLSEPVIKPAAPVKPAI